MWDPHDGLPVLEHADVLLLRHVSVVRSLRAASRQNGRMIAAANALAKTRRCA
jgi:hypothetical protein